MPASPAAQSSGSDDSGDFAGPKLSFVKRAAQIRHPEALYGLVTSMARAVDSVRVEIADNTAAVDSLCHEFVELKKLILERLDGSK